MQNDSAAMSSTAVRTDTSALIEADDVCVELAGRVILDHVHARIEPGEIVTLVGLNGSGKTTLVRALLGLIALDCGSVTRRRGLKIGYSPQTVNIDASLPLTVRRFLTLGESIGDARLNALLNEVGLGDILAHQVADLSGGELHRVLLARAMAREPDLLVLDEPLAGVDVAGQSEIYRLIARVRDRYNCGVLMVSHDLHLVMAATDTVVCINHHVCCTGHPESVARHPEFISLFGRQVAEALAVYTHQHDHAHDAAGEVIPLDQDKDPVTLTKSDTHG